VGAGEWLLSCMNSEMLFQSGLDGEHSWTFLTEG